MNARIKPKTKTETALRERLPSMSADDAARLRRLASRRRRIMLHAPGAWIEISGPLADASPWAIVGAGDARFALALTDDRDDAAGDLHWSDFDGESRLVAWSLAHERALAWLGELLGSRLLPLALVDGEPSQDVAVGLSIGDDAGAVCGGAMRVPAEWLDRLLADERGQDVASPAPSRAASDVPAPVAVLLDGPALRIDELKALVAGDVIIAGSRRDAIERVRLEDGAHAWRARWDGHALHVIDAGEARNRPQWRESMNAVNEEGAPARGVADIPVRIEFAIGEVTLPFGELERIEAGYVFELGRAIDGASVDIRANGQRIGRGQIVAIGDALGVRITDRVADGLQ